MRGQGKNHEGGRCKTMDPASENNSNADLISNNNQEKSVYV
jgi:hypothetical protein